MEFYHIFLPVTTLAYFLLVFVLRSVIMWKKTGINPFVFKNTDRAHDYVGRIYKVLILIMWMSIICFSFFPNVYSFLIPLPFLEIGSVKVAGVFLISIAFVWTSIAQYQMNSSWRIGIDYSEKPKLVTSGLFKYSRNPVFLGVIATYTGIFFISPNALSFALLLAMYITLQIQIRLEEEFLIEKLGQDYKSYFGNVGRWIF